MSNEYGIDIGDANYGGGIAKNFKLKKGENNLFRILPPLGALAAKGVWAVDHRVHWGYKSGNNQFRTFECIEERDRNTKMVTRRCPECDKNARIKADYESKHKKAVEFLMKEKGMGEDQAKKVAYGKLEAHKAIMDQYNRSFRFYMNTINEKGEIGVLNIAYAHFKLLRTKIADLRKDSIDPLKPSQGAWFNFTYEGNSGHAVDIAMVGNKLEGERLKPAQLTEDILKRLKNEVADLTDLFKQVTVDQIQKLVDSNGDTGVVDSIFSRGESKTMTAAGPVDVGGDNFDIPGLDDAPKASAAATAPQAQTSAPVASSAPVAPPDVNVSDSEFDDLFGKM